MGVGAHTVLVFIPGIYIRWFADSQLPIIPISGSDTSHLWAPASICTDTHAYNVIKNNENKGWRDGSADQNQFPALTR